MYGHDPLLIDKLHLPPEKFNLFFYFEFGKPQHVACNNNMIGNFSLGTLSSSGFFIEIPEYDRYIAHTKIIGRSYIL